MMSGKITDVTKNMLITKFVIMYDPRGSSGSLTESRPRLSWLPLSVRY